MRDSCITLQISIWAVIEEAVPSSWSSFTQDTNEKLNSRKIIMVELDRKLVTTGGSCDAVVRRGTKFISIYDIATDMWLECQGAQLPVPLYRPGVVKLAGNKL